MDARGELHATRPDGYSPDLPEEFWKNARRVGEPTTKAAINLRLDRETLAYFKAEGPGHLTRMAQVLKAYADAKRKAG